MFDHVQNTVHRLTMLAVVVATVAIAGGSLLVFLPNRTSAEQHPPEADVRSHDTQSHSERDGLADLVDALKASGNAPDDDTMREARRFLSQCANHAPQQRVAGLKDLSESK